MLLPPHTVSTLDTPFSILLLHKLIILILNPRLTHGDNSTGLPKIDLKVAPGGRERQREESKTKFGDPGVTKQQLRVICSCFAGLNRASVIKPAGAKLSYLAS